MQAVTNPLIHQPQFNLPVLKEGAQGDAVRELQQLLMQRYCYVAAVDGIFAVATTSAVKAFQNRVFLPTTGIVDDRTWRAIYKDAPVDMPVLLPGSQGELIVIVQQKLRKTHDYHAPIDGDFGSQTTAAVKAFQTRLGLSADGIVNDKVWCYLSKII
ncbi:MAG: peptidoglycan-binding protein [Nostocaceae cyanobacterium]|nr:peptidoglycan-binding protein [Nostocaceae cyanobacterium]